VPEYSSPAIPTTFKARFTEVLKVQFKPDLHHHEAWVGGPSAIAPRGSHWDVRALRESSGPFADRKAPANGNLLE